MPYPTARRVAAALLGLASALPLLAADAPAAPPAEDAPAPVVTVQHAPEPLTIDGVLDEAIWKTATPTVVEWAHSKKDPKSESPQAKVWLCWDERYLYLGYEVYDQNVWAQASEQIDGPKENRRQGLEIYREDVPLDVIEFFISSGSEFHFWELHHNALNQFNDIACTKLEKGDPANQTWAGKYGILFHEGDYLEDEAEFTFKSAVTMLPKADGTPSTVNDNSDTDTGYRGELRFPWRGVGALSKYRERDKDNTRLPMPYHMKGAKLHMMVVNQNSDLPKRGYFHNSPTFKGGWFHMGFTDWPVFELAE